MVWYCEHCEAERCVTAEITGGSEFDRNDTLDDIFSAVCDKHSLLLRCCECDSTRVEWR